MLGGFADEFAQTWEEFAAQHHAASTNQRTAPVIVVNAQRDERSGRKSIVGSRTAGGRPGKQQTMGAASLFDSMRLPCATNEHNTMPPRLESSDPSTDCGRSNSRAATRSWLG